MKGHKGKYQHSSAKWQNRKRVGRDGEERAREVNGELWGRDGNEDQIMKVMYEPN